MSTFRNPVGPQPPMVYWRRRLVLGLGALAVILIIVLIAVRPGSGKPAASPTPGTTTAATPSATPAAKTSAGSAASVAGAACLPAKVALVPVADKTTYAAGEKPMISMTITNTGTTDCSINLGSTQQELIITSGTETIWDSKDCQTAPVDAQTVLKPGVTVATQAIPWDRTRSSKTTCSASRPAVTAGGASYHLAVKVGALTSKSTVQFLLN